MARGTRVHDACPPCASPRCVSLRFDVARACACAHVTFRTRVYRAATACALNEFYVTEHGKKVLEAARLKAIEVRLLEWHVGQQARASLSAPVGVVVR
eukprot:5837184-Pleurochrysis_carterae.AAC.1